MSFKKCYFFSNNFKFCAVKKDDVELKPTLKFIFLTHLISLYILLNDNHNRKNMFVFVLKFVEDLELQIWIFLAQLKLYWHLHWFDYVLICPKKPLNTPLTSNTVLIICLPKIKKFIKKSQCLSFYWLSTAFLSYSYLPRCQKHVWVKSLEKYFSMSLGASHVFSSLTRCILSETFLVLTDSNHFLLIFMLFLWLYWIFYKQWDGF